MLGVTICACGGDSTDPFVRVRGAVRDKDAHFFFVRWRFSLQSSCVSCRFLTHVHSARLQEWDMDVDDEEDDSDDDDEDDDDAMMENGAL